MFCISMTFHNVLCTQSYVFLNFIPLLSYFFFYKKTSIPIKYEHDMDKKKTENGTINTDTHLLG